MPMVTPFFLGAFSILSLFSSVFHSMRIWTLGWDFFITPNPPCLAMPPEVIELELATAMRDLGCVRADKPIPTLPLSKYSEHPNWRSYTSRTADDRDNDDKCKKMETGDIVHVNKNAYNNGDSDDKNRIKTGTRPLSHGVKRYAKTSQVLRALATYSREVSYERTKQRGEGQNNLPHRQRRRQLKYRQRRKERALYGRPKTSYHAAFMEDKDHNKRDFYALDGSTQELFFSVPLVSSKVNRREIAATWARAIYMSARRLNNLHVMCSDMEELYHLILSDRKLLYYMAPSEVEAKLHPNLAKQGHLHVRNKSRFNPVLLDVFRQLLREKEATLFLMITAEFRKIVQSEQ